MPPVTSKWAACSPSKASSRERWASIADRRFAGRRGRENALTPPMANTSGLRREALSPIGRPNRRLREYQTQQLRHNPTPWVTMTMPCGAAANADRSPNSGPVCVPNGGVRARQQRRTWSVHPRCLIQDRRLTSYSCDGFVLRHSLGFFGEQHSLMANR